MKTKNKIFALVGSTQSGKSTLILKVARAVPRVEIIKSATTRKWREQSDEVFYYFLSKKQFLLKDEKGDFAEMIEYGGEYYGFEHSIIEKIIGHKYGIIAVTEHGILQLEKSGYQIIPIKIIPRPDPGKIKNLSAPIYKSEFSKRIEEDLKRARRPVKYSAEIINSFALADRKKRLAS